MSFLSLVLGLMSLSSFGDAVSETIAVEMESHRSGAAAEQVLFQGRSLASVWAPMTKGAMPRGDRGAPSSSRGSGTR